MRSLLILGAVAVLVAVTAISVSAGKAANSLNGGGQILDGDHAVSFGGNVKEADDGTLSGQFQVNFHSVSVAAVSGGVFHSTEITSAAWWLPSSDTCTAALTLGVDGRFNGEDGWSLIFRAGDNDDTVRFELFDTGGAKVYDTHGGDFGDESSCVGSARTGLDDGSLKIALE